MAEVLSRDGLRRLEAHPSLLLLLLLLLLVVVLLPPRWWTLLASRASHAR